MRFLDNSVSYNEGLRLLTKSEQNDHCVKFYDDEKSLCDALTLFVGSGLSEGDGVLVIATQAHQNAFKKCLDFEGYDSQAAVDRGQLVFRDAGEALALFMDGAVPNQKKFEAVIGGLIQKTAIKYPKVRVYGEIVNLLLVDGNLSGSVDVEELWSQLSKTHSFFLLCSYLISDFNEKTSPDAMAQVCQAHTHSIPARPTLIWDKTFEFLQEKNSVLEQKNRALERELAGRKKIESSLLEAIGRRDESFPIISHELKTPLTSLKLQIQILKRMMLDEKSPKDNETIKKSIEVCETQINRMGGLIDNILNLAEIRLGRFKFTAERFNLVQFTEEVIDQFSKSLVSDLQVQKKPDITFFSEEQLIGCWDRLRLNQLITNLLSNAVKYGNEKPVEVHLCRNVDQTRITLTVQDFGIGIAPENQEKIFRRFERIPSSDHFQGLGLGLYIVRRIVDEYRGTIQVRSELGRGSVFVVELPHNLPEDEN